MSRSNGNTQTESESDSLGPAPGRGRSRFERKMWAFRRYHGIGPNGRRVEEWTQQEIADALGVSRTTIDNWLNQENVAPGIVGQLPRGRRLLLFGMIYGGRTDIAREYLWLLTLALRESEGDESMESESEPHPLDGLDEDFSW